MVVAARAVAVAALAVAAAVAVEAMAATATMATVVATGTCALGETGIVGIAGTMGEGAGGKWGGGCVCVCEATTVEEGSSSFHGFFLLGVSFCCCYPLSSGWLFVWSGPLHRG